MLGIRRHGLVAIDLFQGDATLFVADAQSPSPEGLLALTPPIRHVAVVGMTDPECLGRLKRILDAAGQPQTLRRVTFILGTLDLYYAFQDELFLVFPETAEV